MQWQKGSKTKMLERARTKEYHCSLDLEVVLDYKAPQSSRNGLHVLERKSPNPVHSLLGFGPMVSRAFTGQKCAISSPRNAVMPCTQTR